MHFSISFLWWGFRQAFLDVSFRPCWDGQVHAIGVMGPSLQRRPFHNLNLWTISVGPHLTWIPKVTKFWKLPLAAFGVQERLWLEVWFSFIAVMAALFALPKSVKRCVCVCECVWCRFFFRGSVMLNSTKTLWNSACAKLTLREERVADVARKNQWALRPDLHQMISHYCWW